MSAIELLSQYRALGGVADNVQLRQGPHGWGLFVVDPSQPVRVFTPAHLLIAPKDLRLTRQGHVQVRPQAGLSPDLVCFHEAYQRELGWGAAGLARSVRQHRQWQALPEALRHFLSLLGGRAATHQPPTPEQAFETHCISRQIGVNGHSRLMPVLELINHAPDGAPYVVNQGIGLTGRFTDEVWACYRRRMDGFHFFFNYHFASPCRVVLSCAVTIELPGLGMLRIGRDDGQVEHRQGASWPRITTHPGEIHLSFVALADQDAPTQPREIFVRLMAEHGLPTARGHDLFDGLIAHHRQVLQALIQACEVDAGADVGLAHQLRQVAQGQLALAT